MSEAPERTLVKRIRALLIVEGAIGGPREGLWNRLLTEVAALEQKFKDSETERIRLREERRRAVECLEREPPDVDNALGYLDPDGALATEQGEREAHEKGICDDDCWYCDDDELDEQVADDAEKEDAAERTKGGIIE